METHEPESLKEKLLNEHGKWTKKYMEANDRFESLLPPVYDVVGDKKNEPLVLTNEWLEQCEEADNEVKEAQDKLRELRQQIADL